MRKSLLSLVAILFLSATLGACGGGEKGAPTAQTPGTRTAGPVTIELWHSEVASNQDTLNRLVDQFNASQDEVRVRVSFQGAYNEAMTKLIASLPTGNVPAVMMPGTSHMQMMIDSGAVTPIQDFVDRDGYDLSDLDPKGIQFYTSQGKLWAMPIAIEIPLLYYNKVTFREVGLDPERPPQDLEELRQYSEKLLKRDSAGNVVRSGLAMEIAGWPKVVLAEHGDFFVDNENGRDGRATKVLFDNDTGRWFFQWWHDMVDSGLAFNVGRNPTAAEGFLAIASGRAVMTFAQSGALRPVIDTVEAGVQGVEVGIGRVPGAPGGTGQTLLTGSGSSTFAPRRNRRRPGSSSSGLWSPSSRPSGSLAAATSPPAAPLSTCRRRRMSWPATPSTRWCSAFTSMPRPPPSPWRRPWVLQ
jgi:sn-glycerol 3-phosphate transport system substrate-binding protein